MESSFFLSVTGFHTLVGILLFSFGMIGVLAKKSGITALMSLELMLNGVNLCFVTFSKHHQDTHGLSIILFIILVAAAEAAVALSILVTIFKKIGTVNLSDMSSLKG